MFHYFTIKFHFSFFASFRFFSLIFASNFSLRFTLVIFASKWNKAKRNSSVFFRSFRFFSLFFAIFLHFFAYFRFTFFASLRFSHLCFEAKRSEAKFKSVFSFFSLFFTFFRFFRFFFAFFRFASIFSLNFRLFYLRFRFRFLVFRIEVNHVKLGFFFASKRSEIFTSVSNFTSEAKVRAHPSSYSDPGLEISFFCQNILIISWPSLF